MTDGPPLTKLHYGPRETEDTRESRQVDLLKYTKMSVWKVAMTVLGSVRVRGV